jgi:tRNA1Val (adenine37-N6)-methyltransferase
LYTFDTFFNGSVKIRQNRSGYRFSVDAVLLASHILPFPGDTILDLGTGCGIIPLILAYRHPETKICGVEIQKEFADIASANVQENHMAHQITILCKDMKALKIKDIPTGPMDWIVSNPPYRKANSGKMNPDMQRAIARHETKITLPELVNTARRMLRVSGKFTTIYPAERLTELLLHMHTAGIEPKTIRMIHSYQNSEAKLVLVQGIRGSRPGTRISGSLIIYSKDRLYSDEVGKMFRP